MNDDDLMTLICEQRDKAPMTATVEQVMRRGRYLQHRRRAAWAGGTLVVAAAPAAVIGALPGTTHSAIGKDVTHVPPARLAAWTVTEQPSGDIDVTINQLKNPAGLEQTLRADGIPAVVSSAEPSDDACQPYAGDPASVMTFETDNGSVNLLIHSSALPSGVGVSIFDDPGTGAGPTAPAAGDLGTPPSIRGGNPLESPPSPKLGLALLKSLDGPLAVGLVETSPQCTG
jgi:hypothetical protein